MDQHSVFLVAESDRLEAVQRLRARFDPSFGLVPAHVTLVFPFLPEGGLEALATRLRSLGHRLPIPFSLGSPDSREGTLFCPLVLGRSEATLLHDKLYACLPPELRSPLPFRPHLTLGRVPPGRAASRAFRDAEKLLPFTGTLERLVLERIGPDERSIPEIEIP
jgi:hypothetical protein